MTQPPASQPFNGPTGVLVLNLKKPWGSMGMITPLATIDGYPAQVQWGHNEFTAPAGPRQVQLSCTYMWEYGRASDTVPVQPSSRVEVFYAPPMLTFMRGRVGPVEQQRPGRIGVIAILVVLLIVAALIVFGAIAS